MRTFAIYSDFVVREMGEAKGPTIGEIGRFYLHLDETKAKIALHKFRLHGGKILPEGLRAYGSIALTSTFDLESINENHVVNKDEPFLREVTFLIRDKAGESKSYNFHFMKRTVIEYSDFQNYFFTIKDNILGYQSFREIELVKENREKEEEIESLKQQLNDMKD